MIISSILAVVVFAVMFIMAARDKLSRPAVMGMSAGGAGVNMSEQCFCFSVRSLGSAGAMTRC